MSSNATTKIEEDGYIQNDRPWETTPDLWKTSADKHLEKIAVSEAELAEIAAEASVGVPAPRKGAKPIVRLVFCIPVALFAFGGYAVHKKSQADKARCTTPSTAVAAVGVPTAPVANTTSC